MLRPCSLPVSVSMSCLCLDFNPCRLSVGVYCLASLLLSFSNSPRGRDVMHGFPHTPIPRVACCEHRPHPSVYYSPSRINDQVRCERRDGAGAQMITVLIHAEQPATAVLAPILLVFYYSQTDIPTLHTAPTTAQDHSCAGRRYSATYPRHDWPSSSATFSRVARILTFYWTITHGIQRAAPCTVIVIEKIHPAGTYIWCAERC